MDQSKFMEMYGKFATKMHSIVRCKSQDYSTESDPFKNFRLAPMVGVTPERGVLVRMMDKISRISVLLEKEASVVDESIVDTLLDLGNYSLILACMLEENNGKIKDSPTVDNKNSARSSSGHCCPDSCTVGSCANRNKSGPK
jgi:hypothetical protein